MRRRPPCDRATGAGSRPPAPPTAATGPRRLRRNVFLVTVGVTILTVSSIQVDAEAGVVVTETINIGTTTEIVAPMPARLRLTCRPVAASGGRLTTFASCSVNLGAPRPRVGRRGGTAAPPEPRQREHEGGLR